MKHRGIVMSRKGMVASAHPLISSAGLDILKKGGNAIDAAVAMANTSGVVLPDMCGLGGDVFMLYYDAKTKKISALNGSGCAPKNATIEYFKNHGMEHIPMDGILSVAVPGEVDACMLALEKFGTMKFSELCKDAIDLAENGCPISEKVARHLRTDYDKILRFEGLRKRFLNENNEPLNAGDLYYNPEYAASLKIIAEKGRDAFYEGELAEKFINHSKKHGGLFTMEDLKAMQSEILEPISVNYRDYKVFQTPPVSQGIIHLEEMHILNQFDFTAIKPESAEAVHLMVEAKKLAFNDRIRYFGDPAFVKNPIDEILSEAYAKNQAAKIQMNQSLPILDEIPFDEYGHTTSFVVVDSQGNAASFIHSISASWGSGEEIEGCGILLNNRLGTGFNLINGHPNCLQPHKRTMHTLITYMVTDQQGNLRWVGNTPGGDNQPQWNMQTLCNVIDFGMDVQTALETAKWADAQSSNPCGKISNVLKIEKQIGETELKKLEAMGHTLNIIDPYTCSGASQLIEIRSNGVLFGGSDPRADGCAMPL